MEGFHVKQEWRADGSSVAFVTGPIAGVCVVAVLPALPACIALATPSDWRLARRMNGSVYASAGMLARDRLLENACEQAVRLTQQARWPWLARVTHGDVVRFLVKTRLAPGPEGLHLGDCRMWTAGTSVGGNKNSDQLPYGSFWVGGTGVRAHLFSKLVLGAHHFPPHLPDLHLDHLCRRPLCVAPQHLEPVTREENERRKLRAATQ